VEATPEHRQVNRWYYKNGWKKVNSLAYDGLNSEETWKRIRAAGNLPKMVKTHFMRLDEARALAKKWRNKE